MQHNLNSLALIGCGYMGKEYAKVLKGLSVTYTVIGRSEAPAKAFEDEVGVMPFVGGVELYLKEYPAPKKAIVAVSLEQSFNTVTQLIDAGTKEILMEKPGAITYDEIGELSLKAAEKNCRVYVAYNRRFFTSALHAKKMIEEDGGVSSYRLEFTEWSHKIVTDDRSLDVLSHWFFANSTHVLDLAFYLGGRPMRIHGFTAGALSWYPTASSFSGAGITKDGATFSYYADWESAGRWDVEILTKQRKLILSPLEGLKVQKRGSVIIEDVALPDELDKLYKPGLYLQTQAFLSGRVDGLLSLKEHNENCALYRTIEFPNY